MTKQTGQTQAMLEDVAERFLSGEGGYVVFANWRGAVDIGARRFEEMLNSQLSLSSESALWWDRIHPNTFLKIASINEGVKVCFIGPLVNRLEGTEGKIFIDHHAYIAADRKQLGDLLERMEDRIYTVHEDDCGDEQR